MDLVQLGKALKKGELASTYLLAGEEEALLERALKQVMARALSAKGASDLSVSRLEGKGASAAEIEAATRTGSLFGGRRVVVVRDAQQLAAAEQKKLAEYLKQPLRGATLVLLVRGAGPGTRDPKAGKAASAAKSFQKAVEAGGGVTVDCPRPKARDLPRLAEELLTEQGLSADRDGLHALVDAVGEDLTGLMQAVEKLALYMGGSGSVAAADVAQVVADTRSESIFELTDATAEGDASSALGVLRRLLRDGEGALGILGQLTRHLRNLAAVQALARRGQGQEEIREALGLHPFVVKKSLDQARRFTPEGLTRCLQALAESDRALKGGRLSDEVQLERLLLQLTGGRAGGQRGR
ncbi:MAG TPA: DNA polymerase III subunit delta [Myxococcota bacterium]|nr:DNA polymerase III subunit delta [Myxococcota bacterium]